MRQDVLWRCSVCGAEHEGLPHDWAFEKPRYWDGPRTEDDVLGEDVCVWTDDGGERAYFIRGLLTIPVVDDGDDLRYGVWSTLSKQSFDRVLELWDDPRRVEEPPYFGWLASAPPGYPDTRGLSVDVVTSELEQRPRFVLHDGDHPLVREQREGITVDRLRELAELNLH
jgi:hypothetical protein